MIYIYNIYSSWGSPAKISNVTLTARGAPPTEYQTPKLRSLESETIHCHGTRLKALASTSSRRPIHMVHECRVSWGDHDVEVLGGIFITGWWCNKHLEKYEFVNGKDDPFFIIENKSHVWNQQPVHTLLVSISYIHPVLVEYPLVN